MGGPVFWRLLKNGTLPMLTRLRMKTKLLHAPAHALSLGGIGIALLVAGCDERLSGTRPKTAEEVAWEAGAATREQWLEKDRALGVQAAGRERRVAELRADFAAQWSSVIVALKGHSDCLGTSWTGFSLSREGGSVFVAPWAAHGWEPDTVTLPDAGLDPNSVRMGAARALSQAETERLLSEAALYYLGAVLSVAPLEQVGPLPADPDKVAEWMERYLAADGHPAEGHPVCIEIRVETPRGLQQYRDMWERGSPGDFVRWVSAYGTAPPVPSR